MTNNEIIQSITLLLIGIGVFLAFKQLHDQHEWYRREKALSYSSLYHPGLREITKELEKNFNLISRSPDDPVPIEEIKVKIEKNKELAIYLSRYLNYYESVSLAYYYKLADEDVLFHLLSGSLITYRKKLKNYIDFIREREDNQELWINLEKLSERWEHLKKSKKTEKSNLGTIISIGKNR